MWSEVGPDGMDIPTVDESTKFHCFFALCVDS